MVYVGSPYMLACNWKELKFRGHYWFVDAQIWSSLKHISNESYLRPHFAENFLLSVFRPCSSECLLCRSSIWHGLKMCSKNMNDPQYFWLECQEQDVYEIIFVDVIVYVLPHLAYMKQHNTNKWDHKLKEHIGLVNQGEYQMSVICWILSEK